MKQYVVQPRRTEQGSAAGGGSLAGGAGYDVATVVAVQGDILWAQG